MKKNVTKYDAATVSAISATAQAKRDADKAYKDAKADFVNGLAAFLADNPEAVVVNKDLAAQAGIHPCHMAAIVAAEGWRKGIATDSMTVTKRYAEVDETGAIIPGGITRTENRSMTVYTKKNDKRRW